MNTPYIGFSNETLKHLAKVKSGDTIRCPNCNQLHILEAGKQQNGEPSELLLFYKCGEKTYLGAIAGKSIVDVDADISGEILDKEV